MHFHTIRKSQIVSKNSIFRKNSKIVNLNFRAKNELSIVIYDTLISIRIWVFTPKIVKIKQFSIIVDSVFTQNHYFWRENSNYSGKSGI